MSLLAAILAGIMGLTLGLLGGGGSILTVPILVYALGVDEKSAIATSLLVVGATSTMALVAHARDRNVSWRTGLVFGLFGMGGAFGGGLIAQFIPGTFLMLLFAALMLITSVAMLKGKKKSGATQELEDDPKELPVLKIALEGSVVGLVTGLVGAGGGFLVVPALVLLGGLSMKRAVGTSLLVISMKSFAGFAGFAGHVAIDYKLALGFVGAALVGTLVGVRLSRHIDGEKLRKGFAVFVLVMAVYILSKQLDPSWLQSFTASSIFLPVVLIVPVLALGGAVLVWQQFSKTA